MRRRPLALDRDFERPAVIVVPLDVALFLEVVQMLMHSGQRGEAEVLADFAQRRRVAVLGDIVLKEIDELLLPFGERGHHLNLYRNPYSSSETSSPTTVMMAKIRRIGKYPEMLSHCAPKTDPL